MRDTVATVSAASAPPCVANPCVVNGGVAGLVARGWIGRLRAASAARGIAGASRRRRAERGELLLRRALEGSGGDEDDRVVPAPGPESARQAGRGDRLQLGQGPGRKGVSRHGASSSLGVGKAPFIDSPLGAQPFAVVGV